MVEFATLVTTESRGLIAAVQAIVGDRHQAEEIVQESFERCFRRWRRVSRMERPGAWVRRVAINQAISARRKMTTERHTVERMGSLAGVDTGAGADPLDVLADRHLWDEVRALPPEQATAIALRYAADLDLEQIAETMENTVPAVKSLLHRGRTTLRGSLALHTTVE